MFKSNKTAAFKHTWRVLLAGLVALTSTFSYAAPQQLVSVSSNISARPGQPSFSWTYDVASTPSLPTQTFPVRQIAYYNVTDPAFNWILTRGKFQFSTNGGGTWVDLPHGANQNPTFTDVAGKIFRFLDQLPADSTTTNNVGTSWTLVGNPDTVGSGNLIRPDTAPTGIATTQTRIFDDAPLNFVQATLNPTDNGYTEGGVWRIDSQSVANLFSITGSASGDNGLLRRGSGTMPALGTSVAVTARYYDIYQTDNAGAPISGEGFAQAFNFVVTQNATTDIAGLGPEFSANTFTTDSQTSPAIARLSNGNFVVVWRSTSQDNDVGSTGIYARIFNQSGAAQSGEFRISPLDNISQNTPHVAALSGGRFVVSYNDASNNGDVNYRLVDASNNVGPVLSPHAASSGSESTSRIATLSDGNFAITWVNSTPDISARVFNGSTGAPVAAEFTVNSTTTGSQSAPDIASIGGGNFVVVWRDAANSGDILARTANSAGPISLEFGVATGAGTQNGPRVAGYNGGNFTVAFQETNRDGDTGGQSNVYMQRYSGANTTVGGQVRVNSVVPGSQSGIGLAAMSDGGVFVGWQVLDQDLDSNGTFGRRFDSSGVAIDAADAQLNQKRQYSQTTPVIAAGASGTAAIAWADSAQEGQGVTNSGVEARVFNPVAASAAPTVTSPTSTAVTINSATLGGNVTSDGGAAITARGVVLAPTATNNNPLIGGGGVTNLTTTGTTGVFTLSAGSLAPNTAYSFKAYATNSVDTGYSSVGTFTTPGPNLTINDVTANEGNSGTTNFTFTVSLSAPAGPGGVSFGIATANGTATAGSDYVANTLTSQTIPSGSSTYNFTVLANGDTLNEANETFFVNVTSVTGATVSDGQGVGTITNDDALPSLSINDVSVTEGNSGTTNAVFAVTLSAASGQTVQVNYASANGTATQPADYANTSGTLTFTPGQTSQPITVPVAGDAITEANETYFVNLSGASNATISDNQGLGTIVDDDLPTLAINDVSITEGNSGTQVLNFTVTRTGVTASAVGFSFATADSTATTADSDYASTTGAGTIPSGGASATTTVSVTINGDAIFENNESFFINLSAPTNATISDNQGIGTITNDDTAPTLAINDVSIVEGNSGTQNVVFTVTRTGLTALPASFTATTANGTASAPSDYLAALVGSTSIAAGGATGTTTLTATINGDAVVEANESFFVNLTAPANATIADGQAIGTINNDDTAGVVITQSGGSTDVTEGGTTDTLTLVLTAEPTSDVTITFNVGTQVSFAPNPLVITPTQWNVPQTITVSAVDDAVVEGSHSATVGLIFTGDANFAAITPNSVSQLVLITDNDLPTLAINDVSITEGNSGTQVLNFTVTRTGITPSAVGFSFATADDTATAGSDYVTATGTGTIPSGGATGTTTVSVTINGDAIFENNESFFINLSAPSNATIADNQGIGTITTDDIAPTLAINDVSIVEGNSGTQNVVFTVTRTGLTALPASFTATTANGTATAPSDYLAVLTGSTTIAAGGATGTTTLTATINGDAVVEPDETFVINLTVPSNATISDNQATGTITNDDTAGIVLTQSGGSTDVTEGGAPDTYTLVLTSQPTSNVSIALNPGTQVTVATSPVVFTPANWNIAQTVTATAVDDTAVEGPHTGTISHAVTSADTVYNGFSVANVTANIIDNDLPTLSIGDVSITEGNAGTQVLNFTVTRTGTTPSAVGFSFATADDTATAGSDYASATGTGTIPSGGASATTTVNVTINGDAIFENNESFFVNLSAPTDALISDAQGVGTITNDETAPTLAINDVSIVEGNSGTQSLVFTVTRTGLTALPAQFTAVTTPGTASAPLDYLAALTGSTSIAAGGASGSTTLSATINGDLTIEPNETFTVDLSAPVNASIADGQGLGTITNDDGEPTFTPASAISTQQGSPSAVATLGAVSDLTDPPNSLTVALISGGTVTGVTPTALTNTNGTVTASLAASCTAASGTLRLRVTDSGGLTDTDDVQINVTPNSPPSLAYNAINVGVGNTITQNPTAGLSDNGSVTGVSILSAGTYAGSVSVSTTGVLSLSNATPAGTHSITVRATDNCGAQTDAVVQVQVAQASTIKAISSNVNPARFGQSVSLSVQVAGVDPSGSVEFFNGSTSLGTAPLTVSPSGGNNLKLATLTLASLPVGSLNLTASYPGDTNNAASTSQVLAQSVVAADTSVTLSSASNPLNLGSSSFNVSVQALTPGGGVPQGSVTLSAGAVNCVASLTAGSGSCSLNFASAGYAAITASYTPSTSNHNASTGGLAVVVVPTPSSADLRVRIGNGMRNISAGALVRYDIVVENLGTQAAVGRLEVPLSADFGSASYSCTSAGSASCGAVGSGSIDTEVSVAPGGVVIYSLLVTAPISPERTITQTARITAKAPTADPDLSNNDAADADPMGLLSDGYEDGLIGE